MASIAIVVIVSGKLVYCAEAAEGYEYAAAEKLGVGTCYGEGRDSNEAVKAAMQWARHFRNLPALPDHLGAMIAAAQQIKHFRSGRVKPIKEGGF
jgi:hypothetical protein